MALKSSIREQWRKVSFESKNRRRITVNSNFNSSEKDSLNTSNSDNCIGNSNLPFINVHTKSSLNNLIIFQRENDTQSINSIEYEITDDNNTTEEISCHKIQQKR